MICRRGYERTRKKRKHDIAHTALDGSSVRTTKLPPEHPGILPPVSHIETSINSILVFRDPDDTSHHDVLAMRGLPFAPGLRQRKAYPHRTINCGVLTHPNVSFSWRHNHAPRHSSLFSICFAYYLRNGAGSTGVIAYAMSNFAKHTEYLSIPYSSMTSREKGLCITKWTDGSPQPVPISPPGSTNSQSRSRAAYPIAPSASSLRTASCDSDPPLIPPVTLTRALACAQVADW